MKHAPLTRGAALLALLFAGGLVGCGDDNETPTPARPEIKSEAVTLPKKFNVPPGADPSVSAELGGAGFEKIAADSGWQTGGYTPDQLPYAIDTTAIKGGRITQALTEFPATFRDMGKDANTEVAFLINALVFEPLIDINPLTLEFIPALATHWKVDPDGQTYYFRIDPNARFHDGHPVTTEDVLATYKLGSDPTILDPYQNAKFGSFDPPVAISKYIFKVRSKERNWRNMFDFGISNIMPAHIIGNLNGGDYLKQFQFEAMPGTGPYTILPDEVQKGASLTLTRVADWWGVDRPVSRGQYNFDKITIAIIADENTELNKLMAGEIDIYRVRRAQWWVEKFEYEDIKRGIQQKRKIYTDDPQGVTGIAFNTRRPPFDDPRIRLAFVHLFNREQLIEKLMYKQYELMDSYYPNSMYANPNNPKFRYDPERARQLLAEAGYTVGSSGLFEKNGKPLEVEMIITQDAERIFTPFQQDLAQSGVKLNLRIVDNVSRFKMAMERNFSMTYQGWTGTIFPNPFNVYSSELADEPNTNNVTGIKSPRIDELIAKERTTFDQAARVAIIREIDSILMASNHYALSWFAGYERLVYWNKFNQPKFYLNRIGDWKDVVRYWWFDPEKAATVAKGRRDKSVKMPVGETDVRFWTEYSKSRGMVEIAAPGQGTGDSTAPVLK